MPRRHTTPAHFRKTLLALAMGTVLAPHAAWALNLEQAPPGTVQPYVTPNVIISVDDSGSMGYRLDSESTSGVDNTTTPLADGTWPVTRRRINVLKYALKSVFDPAHPNYDNTLLPDNKIRLAWQVMWNNGGAQNAGNVNSTSMNTNSMRPLEGAHRTNFLNFVTSLSAKNGTPSHLMFKQADEYMRQPLGINSVWASKPGSTGAPFLGCRRNYHIMMTDGRWNGTDYGIPDSTRRDNATNIKLPDGTDYGGTTAADQAKTALYRDGHNGSTLADWAFYSWGTALQTSGLTGAPTPATDYSKAPTTENFGKDSNNKDAVLERFWNPRYNPATWPHMVTYTIGFSQMATTWPGAPTIISPTAQVPFGFDGSFADFVTGAKSWPKMDNENKRSLDLWHAALNGRGRYYAIEKGEDLEKAFRDIFAQINTQTDPDMTSTATSGSNTSRNDVGKFTGAYEPKNAWKGFVVAETVKKDGTTVPSVGWGGKNTAFKMDDASFSVANRFILSWSDEWKTSKEKGGSAFKWDNSQNYLSTGQKYWLGLNTNATGVTVKTNGENHLNFIRGDRGLEGSESIGYTAAKPLRERQSRQGDIINSVVWYTGTPSSGYPLSGYSAFTRANKTRLPMIYVGGNDGMLHGFSAADGEEKIAYVPRGVIPSLTRLSDPGYNNKHRFFVDGSPMTGDVDMGLGVQDPNDPAYSATYTSDWRTLLVGTLGAGGKGYFVLDVTNPDDTSKPGVFAEANAQSLVVLDRTRSTEGSMSAPICATMTGTAKTACDQASQIPPNCNATGLPAAQKSACLTTEGEDQDIGNITARPVLDETNAMRTTQITRMNNNRWAVVLGNGYNSANQRPVLLIQYLDGNKELVRVQTTSDATGTGNANDNGLMAPRLVDINGDERPDVAYAGDNLGNLWKFDLTNVDDTQWKVAFGGQPLFTATGPASLGSASRTIAQSITIAPTVRPNDRKKKVGTGASAKDVDVGGMMVTFGTGRNVTKIDESDVNVQTLYSVLDNTRYRTVSTTKGKRLEVHPGGGTCTPIPKADCAPTPTPLGKGVTNAKLAKRSVVEVNGGTAGQIDATDTLDWVTNNGWYMDFPAVGERQLKPIEMYDGSNILAVYSQVPAKGSNLNPNVETCDASTVDEERQYRTFINIMDGKKPSVQLVDANNDGFFNAADNDIVRKQVAKGAHNLISGGNKVEDIDVKNNRETLARMPELSLRPNWRQLK